MNHQSVTPSLHAFFSDVITSSPHHLITSTMFTYSPPPDLLRDRVILITGASDGIGKAVALAAAAHGAQVVLHGRNVRKLEAVYDAIVGAGGARPSILPLDLEKAGPEEYERLVAAMDQEFGRLD